MNFHYRTNSVKINNQISPLNSKNPIFGPFSQFLERRLFSKKIWLCHAQLHKGFQHHVKIQRNLIIQFQENTWRDDGRSEGRAEPILQDPFSYCQGSYKNNWSRLAFTSLRQRVQYWSNQKLLHHTQHAKNQLNLQTNF